MSQADVSDFLLIEHHFVTYNPIACQRIGNLRAACCGHSAGRDNDNEQPPEAAAILLLRFRFEACFAPDMNGASRLNRRRLYQITARSWRCAEIFPAAKTRVKQRSAVSRQPGT